MSSRTITDHWELDQLRERAEQETDDAYVRADLTPLSTKASGEMRLSYDQQ